MNYTANGNISAAKETTAQAIKVKTDNIGASVALESGGNVAAIKANTDTLGQYKKHEAEVDCSSLGASYVKIKTITVSKSYVGKLYFSWAQQDDNFSGLRVEPRINGESLGLEGAASSANVYVARETAVTSSLILNANNTVELWAHVSVPTVNAKVKYFTVIASSPTNVFSNAVNS